MPYIMSMMKNRLSSLSVNNASSHPSAKDSSHIQAELFEEDEPQPQEPYVPFVTDVTIKHSGVFNSQRAGGMSSLEQLQFVQLLKSVIVEEAPLVFGGFKDFKVTAVRKEKSKPQGAPRSLGDELEHVASLIAKSETEWRVLVVGDGTEYLADAVESLWEKVLLLAGSQRGNLKVGDKLPVVNERGEEVVGRIESGTTLATQV